MTFITDLNCLARYCNYWNLHEQMICDRIVVGIHDNNLSQKMQLEPALTLKKPLSYLAKVKALRNNSSGGSRISKREVPLQHRCIARAYLIAVHSNLHTTPYN